MAKDQLTMKDNREEEEKLKNKTEKGTGGLARHDPLSWPSQKTNYRLAWEMAEQKKVHFDHLWKGNKTHQPILQIVIKWRRNQGRKETRFSEQPWNDICHILKLE